VLRTKSTDGSDGITLLKFAQAYGFRNIQNIMRKIKQGKCDYDYVELMACPSGCTNGGGQIKLSQVNEMLQQSGDTPSLADNQQLVKAVSEILHAEEPTSTPAMDEE